MRLMRKKYLATKTMIEFTWQFYAGGDPLVNFEHQMWATPNVHVGPTMNQHVNAFTDGLGTFQTSGAERNSVGCLAPNERQASETN